MSDDKYSQDQVPENIQVLIQTMVQQQVEQQVKQKMEVFKAQYEKEMNAKMAEMVERETKKQRQGAVKNSDS